MLNPKQIHIVFLNLLVMCYGNQMKSDRKDQCNLFNQFFCDQFSDPSLYAIDIDFSSNNLHKIDFTLNDIADLLKDLDSNKSPGPDENHGRILKKLLLYS